MLAADSNLTVAALPAAYRYFTALPAAPQLTPTAPPAVIQSRTAPPPAADPHSTVAAPPAVDLPLLPYPQPTDNLLLRLQLNQRLAAFLRCRKHEERTASVGIYYVVTCAPNARDLRMRQLPSYSTTSTKKELPVVECMDQGYVVTCVPKRP